MSTSQRPGQIVRHDPDGWISGGSTLGKLISEADADREEALAAITAEHDEGRITAVEAAQERATLLQDHIARCAELRREHLGGAP